MTVGELWVANPIFPWVVMTLAGWVICVSLITISYAKKIIILEKGCEQMKQDYEQIKQELLCESQNTENELKKIQPLTEQVETNKKAIFNESKPIIAVQT